MNTINVKNEQCHNCDMVFRNKECTLFQQPLDKLKQLKICKSVYGRTYKGRV